MHDCGGITCCVTRCGKRGQDVEQQEEEVLAVVQRDAGVGSHVPELLQLQDSLRPAEPLLQVGKIGQA